MNKRFIICIIFSLISLCAINAANQVKGNMQLTARIGLKTDSIKLDYDYVEKVKHKKPHKVVQEEEGDDTLEKLDDNDQLFLAVLVTLFFSLGFIFVLNTIGYLFILLIRLYKKCC